MSRWERLTPPPPCVAVGATDPPPPSCIPRCHELDPGDHLASFYLGYQLARARQVTEAVAHVRTALQRRPDHLSSLHLLALLLTAENQHSAALEVRRGGQLQMGRYTLTGGQIQVMLTAENQHSAALEVRRDRDRWTGRLTDGRTGRGGAGRDGTGRDGTGRDGTGRDGQTDGTGREGRDGTGRSDGRTDRRSRLLTDLDGNTTPERETQEQRDGVRDAGCRNHGYVT